jgi:hypothetical protein
MNVIDRPLLEQQVPPKSRLRIIDCDIHPTLHARADLNPFLPKRWQQHLKPTAIICARPISAPRRIRAPRR